MALWRRAIRRQGGGQGVCTATIVPVAQRFIIAPKLFKVRESYCLEAKDQIAPEWLNQIMSGVVSLKVRT